MVPEPGRFEYDALELVAAPVIVPGGEVVKNDFSYSLDILARINDVVGVQIEYADLA